MVRMLKYLIGLVVGLGVALAALIFVARFGDGPIALILGGPLQHGEMAPTPTDWSFATDIQEIEHQLAADELSRTTWILVHEGAAYIPASLSFPPGKNWHERALVDGAAIVRVAGVRYPVMMERVLAPHEIEAIRALASAKYTGSPPGESWLFRLDERTVE